MSFSAIVWTFGFCFFLMGSVLPWKPWPAINWVLIGIGCTVFFAAFKLDRLIWRRYAEARAILRQASASRGIQIRQGPDPDC